MSIAVIENDIIEQLESYISTLKIEGFPDNGDYNLTHSKGAVLVSYTNSFFETETNFEFIQQEENIEFALLLLVRGLRRENGAYGYIDTIKEALTGFKPTGCSKMFPTDINFVRIQDGIWEYSIGFRLTKENYS